MPPAPAAGPMKRRSRRRRSRIQAQWAGRGSVARRRALRTAQRRRQRARTDRHEVLPRRPLCDLARGAEELTHRCLALDRMNRLAERAKNHRREISDGRAGHEDEPAGRHDDRRDRNGPRSRRPMRHPRERHKTDRQECDDQRVRRHVVRSHDARDQQGAPRSTTADCRRQREDELARRRRAPGSRSATPVIRTSSPR